ncbi:aminomethyl-transferring glycine dehydrogenase, partial [Ruminococcaceae bacterium OttesenSCG-928-O06]|nr:aminomethyl-transferring glycine dehydrogenase [Ruminococcaceae bacterium OttesenSCG-928-O06]
MGSYIPATAQGQQQMLQAIGLAQMDDLFADVPQGMRAGTLALPEGKSELEVRRMMEGAAAQNVVYPTIFRGAGAYRHYIPAIVKQVAAKETFLTAYTPYQAEISQGVLQ